MTEHGWTRLLPPGDQQHAYAKSGDQSYRLPAQPEAMADAAASPHPPPRSATHPPCATPTTSPNAQPTTQASPKPRTLLPCPSPQYRPVAGRDRPPARPQPPGRDWPTPARPTQELRDARITAGDIDAHQMQLRAADFCTAARSRRPLVILAGPLAACRSPDRTPRASGPPPAARCRVMLRWGNSRAGRSTLWLLGGQAGGIPAADQ